MLLHDRKGQFSIIAALLVAAVLISAVVITYSSIRYSTVDDQPQILSSIDETNLGLKEILGFTVGYYGSVLKVTGNMTYAQQLAQNYLKSGLNNMGDVQPEWGAVFNLQNLQLNASWFSTNSYSQGSLVVNYNLTGLGIYGASYNASARLNVQILNSTSASQAQLVILRDGGEPLINLGKSNLQFYRYDYNASTWNLVEPAAIASYANGTYVLDLPSGVNGDAYVIQINDNRGLMVLASSYTQFTSKVSWNTTGFSQIPHYVDEGGLFVGSDSNFYDQQAGPDGNYDTINEAVYGSFNLDYYPTAINLLGQTSVVSGGLSDLQGDNSAYLQLHSYPIAYSSAYNTIGFDSQNSAILTSSSNSISWTHTTSTGNDRLLLVSVDVLSTGTPTTVVSVTYGGVALTQVATAYSSVNQQVRSYVFYLVNPVSGTKTITASFATSSYAVGGSIIYTNVNQTSPLLANAVNTGSSTSPSILLTASQANDKLLFGHLATQGTFSYTVTEGAQQTNRWASSGSYRQSGTNYYMAGRGSDKSVTTGTVSMSWTASNSAKWAAIAVLLQPTQVATSFACSAEFSGTSNTDIWNNLQLATDASATSSGVNVTYRLYNYTSGSYSTDGDGYLTDTLTTGDKTKTQTITSGRYNFRSATGAWKLNITATQTMPFDLKLDMARYSPNENNYALNLQEQFLNVNASNPRQDLCIKTGSFSNEALIVQVLHGSQWVNLMTLQPNYFNNVTLIPYIDSITLTIRFVGANDQTDNTASTFAIDSVYIKDEPDVAYFINRQQSTFTIEILQNGTMRWLGQNLQTSTQTIPVPPVPVKAIHVNQTVNGVNREVPFQLEDWASNYQIPLGLSSNTTVYGNRQMIVILLDSGVSDFTVWWDGKDNATQTALAYTPRFTLDNPNSATLTNGNLTLLFSGGTVKSTVAGTGTYSTATFMRINQEASTYGAGCSYVIHHGIVRDIVMQEAEWNTGAPNCPNLYANIIVTLPANATYYTYNTRLMFITSSQARTITDLCPIKLVSSLSGQAMTEDGTQADYPIIANGTNTYSNTGGSSWTEHHFSQIITAVGKGAGIMYTDKHNQLLYTFDSIAGQSTGALNPDVSQSQIELLSVALSSVSFTYAYDVSWQGAVATFDGQTPLCSLYDATTPWGLWILAETPPTLTVAAKS
jgi:hypothetical protein